MTDTEPGSERTWQYRFTQPDGTEIEAREFNGDDTAEAYARDLSKTRSIPIVIHRFHGHVDWQYVTEVDERP